MKKCYVSKNFTSERENMLYLADSIMREYSAGGYELTLRQLYYQFVAKDLIENSERSYKRLGSLVNDGRLAGYLDWDIVDRTRRTRKNITDQSPQEAFEWAVKRYNLDKWKNQDVYIEVWVEKEALGQVVEMAVDPYDVRTLCCKGYLSQSAMFEASQRFVKQWQDGKECHLIYLGDHDPSGLDMSRDIKDRLNMFFEYPADCICPDETGFVCDYCCKFDVEVEHHRVALNMAQIKEFNPPPNPAKLSDSRCREYIKKYGRHSWELDALSPEILNKLIRDKIEELIDLDQWQEDLDLEENQIAVMRAIIEDMDL